MLALVPALLSAAAASELTQADVARAYMPVPMPSSHVVGVSPGLIFAAMNRHLTQQPHHTQPCEQYTHGELNELARLLWGYRNPDLAAIYDSKNDNRQFHFDSADGLLYKEKLWAQETLLAATKPEAHGEGTEHHKMVRDGKCAELVMWWIHHLSAEDRAVLSAEDGFKVPLLPANGEALAAAKGREDKHSKEYVYQVSCSDCHSTGDHNATHALRPTEAEAASDPAPGTCPVDSKSGLPSVWCVLHVGNVRAPPVLTSPPPLFLYRYQPMSDVGNRKKRCDWDYGKGGGGVQTLRTTDALTKSPPTLL